MSAYSVTIVFVQMINIKSLFLKATVYLHVLKEISTLARL